MKDWSNLAKIVYKRTYSRDGETWEQTVDRVIRGNTEPFIGTDALEDGEVEKLREIMLARKAMPAGRGLWFSGTQSQKDIGGMGLNNCSFLTMDNWGKFIIAQDYLMLGSGVGMSVEHKYVSKLPKVRNVVSITHEKTNDADFIVPDSREGWCKLTKKVLESYFVTGKSFTYSTICLRDAGEPIKRFGGKASGSLPLIAYVEKLSKILNERAGKHIRPIDAVDIVCAIGEMVVSGNVRRSAIIILGDSWDKEYLKAKRWDLGGIPTQRAMANFSVVCEDTADLHPLFWETYKHGEPFGIVNVKNMRKFARTGELKADNAGKFARTGELKADNAVGTNPCFTIDTKILTSDGYRTFESLLGKEVEILQDNRVKGALVDNKEIWNFNYKNLTIDKNKASNIRQTAKNADIYKITTVCGREVKATANHHFATNNSSMTELKDLKIGDKLLIAIPQVFQSNIESLDWKKGLISGLISGDGTRTHNSYAIDLWLNPEQEYLKEQLESYISEIISEHKYAPKTNGLINPKFNLCSTNNKTRKYRLVSSGLTKALEAEGFTNKHDVSFLHNKSKDFKAGFISGMIYSDGHIDYNNKSKSVSIRISQSNLELLQNLMLILQELGILSKTSMSREAGLRELPDGKGGNNYYSCKASYRLMITGLNNVKNSLKCLTLFDNKKDKLDLILKTLKSNRNSRFEATIKSIDYVGKEDVYCLTEDVNRTLIAEGFTARRCAEIPLADGEVCNLQEIFLPNLENEEEFKECARLMFRWGKRVSMETYHEPLTDRIVKKNRRIGVGITGCLQSKLFDPNILDRVYKTIKNEDYKYSEILSIPESIRTTTVKPSGTLSLLGDCTAGIHPAFSRYYIRRVRFASNDALLPVLREAGHPIEPVKRLDGTLDHNTQVVSFFCKTPYGTPCADEDWTLEKQLQVVLDAQRFWSDNSVSVTVYYKKDEIDFIKDWLDENLKTIKTISFLCYNEHGFEQAPYEAIDETLYKEMTKKIKSIDFESIMEGDIDSVECAEGFCPIK